MDSNSHHHTNGDYEIDEHARLTRRITNATEEAVYDVLSGPAAAARALGVKRQAASQLAVRHPIKDRLTALRVQEATRAAGRVIPAAELMELVPWLGPEVHGDDPVKRRRAIKQREEWPRPESNWDKDADGGQNDGTAAAVSLRAAA